MLLCKRAPREITVYANISFDRPFSTKLVLTFTLAPRNYIFIIYTVFCKDSAVDNENFKQNMFTKPRKSL